MTDEELCAACKQEQPAAQKALYDKYARQMMAVCMRYAKDESQAKDMLQEGFIKVFQKIDAFRGEGALGGWIRRIMVRSALDMLRREKNFMNSSELSEVESSNSVKAEVLDNMGAGELMALINNMPTGYRTVFNMFAIEGYSHKEIAAELGVSESTSKTQFSKAKAYLKKLLPESILKDYGAH